ncbi:MAG: pyrroline-5-carboxylate reductase [Tissierellia bacterium]|nr:pyrroline-5-carboxylate reductase [Tissierellia bacterium]MDD4781355.1 pyrroline-5-carboxylate reductase [Tissierellia bacterium]
MYKIGFIGAGNIVNAILTGMSIKKFDMSRIYVNDLSGDAKEKLSVDFGINCAKDNIDVIQKCDYIFFAIKPQYYKSAIDEVNGYLTKDKTAIIIAPGYTIESFKKAADKNVKVVRAMPNTPAIVSEAMTGICYDKNDFTKDEEKNIIEIFESFGKVEVLPEYQMDTIVAVSSSAPAYVYIMIEAMGDAGVLTGLPRQTAYKMAAQAVAGAAKVVYDTDIHPGELKDAVCSPGGTTIEAVKVLENRGFRSALIESMNACYNKTQELKNQN